MSKNKLVLISIFLNILLLISSCKSTAKNAPISINPPDKIETQATLDNNKPQTQEDNTQIQSTKDQTIIKNPTPEITKPETIDSVKKGWYYTPNPSHTTPEIPKNIKDMLISYSGYYVGDTSSKVIYLTFDEGYENGYTSNILDILKENDVKAAFFVTRPYILKEQPLLKRMVDEGHIVGNHTSKHLSMPTLTENTSAFKKEFTDTEDAYKSVIGTDMPNFFRPPMGEYSSKSLKMTQDLGYKTIFWSFAHKDWLVNEQPTVQTSHDRVLKGSHNGAILLLHAVSKSNTEALDSIIKDLKSQGYSFKTLYELK